MDEEEIRRWSYHEAGHAVAHHLLHSKFELVALEEDSAAWQTYTSSEWRPPTNAQDRGTQTIVALAGDVAAALFGYTAASPADAERVDKLTAHFDPHEADAYEATMKRKTRLLLDTPERLGALKALADHFFREAPLSEDHRRRHLVPYTEIVAIIDDALNRDSS